MKVQIQGIEESLDDMDSFLCQECFPGTWVVMDTIDDVVRIQHHQGAPNCSTKCSASGYDPTNGYILNGILLNPQMGPNQYRRSRGGAKDGVATWTRLPLQ